MSYARKLDNAWVEIQGEFVTQDGTQYPANWIELSGDADKQAAGVAAIKESEPPKDTVVLESTLADVKGVPTRKYKTRPMTEDEIRTRDVPSVVTPRQLRLALHGAGKLAQVQAFVDSGKAPAEAVISWEYATEFLRTDPMLNQLATVLQPPMSPADIDALFVAAGAIR